MIWAGGQERGLRSGTLAPALCVGMGHAAHLCAQDMQFDKQWISYLSNKLRSAIQERIPLTVLNGDLQSRYIGQLNIHKFPDILYISIE